MLEQLKTYLLAVVRWIGGWPRFILLVVVLAAVAGGLWWESSGKQVPVPPAAQQVTQDINSGFSRDTTFFFAGSAEQVRAFYQQALPARGWRYCGTRATAHCTNLVRLNNDTDAQVDIYRKSDDQTFAGPTIEIWPAQAAGGALRVTISETNAAVR